VPPTPAPAVNARHTARVSTESEASYTSPSPASRSVSSRQSRNRPSSPFPSIRGEHLEKMFFNAPDHDESRCRTCCQTLSRDRRKTRASSTLPPAASTDRRVPDEDLDEGYGGEEPVPAPVPTATHRKDASRETMAENSKLPPQTVLTRVVRELEDDFVHYKA
jgi:hypothetical protein